MKKKFIKNLYQILSFVASYAFVEIMLLISILMTDTKQVGIETYYIIIISFMIGFPVITIIFGFYWIFQVVYFDDDGLKICIFKHIIKEVKWIEVKKIGYSNWMKNPTISIYLNDKYRINFDRRKKIVEIINKNVLRNKSILFK